MSRKISKKSSKRTSYHEDDNESLDEPGYLVDVLIHHDSSGEQSIQIIPLAHSSYDAVKYMADILNGDKGLHRRGADGMTVGVRNSEDLAYQILYNILAPLRGWCIGEEPDIEPEGFLKELQYLSNIHIEDMQPDSRNFIITFYEDDEAQRLAENYGMERIYHDFRELEQN